MAERLKSEVAVIGGGIAGSSAALFLRRLGHQVVVLESGACGAKASGVNYGGVRRQGRQPDQLPLSQRAHALWGDIRQLAGIDGEYVRSGHLKLARNEEDLAALEAYRDLTRDFGLGLRMLTGAEFRKRFPWLGQAVIGGSLCPEDGHANPRLVSPALARAARAAGADIREHSRVRHARKEGEEFVLECDGGLAVRSACVLNCAGAWGHVIAGQFGRVVPEHAIHPVMFVTEPLPLFMDVSLGMQGGGVYARQVDRGNCVIGGGRGYAVDGCFARPGAQAMDDLLRQAAHVIPPLRGAQVIRFWSGYEGNFDDDNPVLGPDGAVPGLFHAFGFCGAGFQLGPAVGEVLADLVHSGRARVPIDTFSIQRFETQARSSSSPSSIIAGQKG
jgi:sarcosine oxidase subunit beta